MRGRKRPPGGKNSAGREYEKTTLLEPLWENRNQMTLYRGLDQGVKGGHFAVHSFLSGVLNSEAQNRPDGNVTIDQYLADEVGYQTRFPSLRLGAWIGRSTDDRRPMNRKRKPFSLMSLGLVRSLMGMPGLKLLLNLPPSFSPRCFLQCSPCRSDLILLPLFDPWLILAVVQSWFSNTSER